MISTDRIPTPGDWHDPELAGIAEQVRPVVDAGKARVLAFEIVRLCLVLFSPGDNRAAAERAGMKWLFHALHALTTWHARALDIDSGEEAKRPASERLTLLDVAGAADRIASIAWCLSPRNRPVPAERWIVHDLAVALRRACGCFPYSRRATIEAMLSEAPGEVRAIVERCKFDCYNLCSAAEFAPDRTSAAVEKAMWTALQPMPHEAKVEYHHTARILLPLLVRDVRAMLDPAHADVSAIEAAIVAHGGTPS